MSRRISWRTSNLIKIIRRTHGTRATNIFSWIIDSQRINNSFMTKSRFILTGRTESSLSWMKSKPFILIVRGVKICINNTPVRLLRWRKKAKVKILSLLTCSPLTRNKLPLSFEKIYQIKLNCLKKKLISSTAQTTKMNSSGARFQDYQAKRYYKDLLLCSLKIKKYSWSTKRRYIILELVSELGKTIWTGCINGKNISRLATDTSWWSI